MAVGEERLRYLELKVRFLEERVRSLRTSRRILMNLLTMRERERSLSLEDLTRENSRLRNRNQRYATALMEGHITLKRMMKKRGTRS